MNSHAITPTRFDFSQLLKASGAAAGRGADAAAFAGTLKMRLAEIQAQTFQMLIGTTAGKNEQGGGNALLFDAAGTMDAAAAISGTGIPGLGTSGRNAALFDPDSAYRMMTDINRYDATWKARFAELGDMKSRLDDMRAAALALADGVAASDDAGIRARLEKFVDDYNGWIRRFDAELRDGGLLANTQAAQVARWELEVAVGNMFNGAAAGVRGMRDLGIEVDAVTNLATIDRARLDAVLAGNRNGAVAAVQEFGRDLARAAELLNAENNFMRRQLDNLDRAIGYIAGNKPALQAEFGLGDPARPTGQTARALAAYEKARIG